MTPTEASASLTFQEELFPEYAPLNLGMVLKEGNGSRPYAALRRPGQFRIFPQQESYSCGSACLRMILLYYWIPTDEETLRNIGHESERYLKSIEGDSLYKTEEQGIGSTGIMAVLRHYRLRGFITKGNNSGVESLSWFISRDIPVIVNWQCEHDGTSHPLAEQPVAIRGALPVDKGEPSANISGAFGHYSVAVGFTGDGREIVLADPSGNVFTMETDYFESKWWDPTPRHRRWMVAVYRDGRINAELRRRFRGLFV